MTVEAASFLDDLDSAYPSRSDFVHEGDDHMRLLKAVLKATFLNADKAFDMALLGLAVVPTGGIIAYNGDTAPDGWGICDGTTYNKSDGSGTIASPDLRGNFIMAASAAHPRGSSGGNESVTPTTGSAGSHAHTATALAAGAHNHAGATAAVALSIAHMPAHNHGGGNHLHAQGGLTIAGSGELSRYPDKNYGTPGAYNTGYSGTIIDTQGSGAAHAHAIGVEAAHTHTVSVVAGGAHTHTVTVATLPPFYALTYIMKL